MGASSIDFSDINNSNNKDKSNHPSQHFLHTIVPSEMMEGSKDPATTNINLIKFATDEFCEKGVEDINTNVKSVIRDYIYGGFKFLGKEQLGLDPSEVIALSNLKDDALTEKLIAIIKKLLLEATQNTAFAEKEAIAFIHAHSQGPAAMVPFIVASAVEHTDEFKIQQPTVRVIDTTLVNNQLYHTLSADELSMLNLETGKCMGEIKGPIKVSFIRVGEDVKSYGFKLEKVETNNPDIAAALKGKNFTADEIKNKYEYKDDEYPHERKTPSKIAAMSTGRFIKRPGYNPGYNYINSKQSKILLMHGQGQSDGVVFHTFEKNGTLIHSFNPTCDHDQPYLGTISLYHALSIFKRDQKQNPTNLPQKLVIPLATGNMGRRHWLELFIEIDAEGHAKAKLRDSQRVGWFYPTWYIASCIRDTFKTPLITEYTTQQAAHNFVDCGDFFLENSNFSLGLIRKPVTQITGEMLREHHQHMNAYFKYNNLNKNSEVLLSSQLNKDFSEIVESDEPTSLGSSLIDIDPETDQIQIPNQEIAEILKDDENVWLDLASSQESINENALPNIAKTSEFVLIDDYLDQKTSSDNEPSNDNLTAARIDVVPEQKKRQAEQKLKQYQEKEKLQLKKLKQSAIEGLDKELIAAQQASETANMELERDKQQLAQFENDANELADKKTTLLKEVEVHKATLHEFNKNISFLHDELKNLSKKISLIEERKQILEDLIREMEKTVTEHSRLNDANNNYEQEWRYHEAQMTSLSYNLSLQTQALNNAKALKPLYEEHKRILNALNDTNENAKPRSYWKFGVGGGVVATTAVLVTSAILWPATVPMIIGVGVIATVVGIVVGLIKFGRFLYSKLKPSQQRVKTESALEEGKHQPHHDEPAPQQVNVVNKSEKIVSQLHTDLSENAKKIRILQKKAFGHATKNPAAEEAKLVEKIKQTEKAIAEHRSSSTRIEKLKSETQRKLTNFTLLIAETKSTLPNHKECLKNIEEELILLNKEKEKLPAQIQNCADLKAEEEATYKIKTTDIIDTEYTQNNIESCISNTSNRIKNQKSMIEELQLKIIRLTVQKYELELEIDKILESPPDITIDFEAYRSLGFSHNLKKSREIDAQVAPQNVNTNDNPSNKIN